MKKKLLTLCLLLLLGLTACKASGDKEASSLKASRESAADSSEKASETQPGGQKTEGKAEATGKETTAQAETSQAAAASAPVETPAPEPEDEYLTIALFGLDANKNPSGNDADSWAKLMRQFRSDCTMIANINMTTGDIKLVSVYRDTFLNTGTDTYQKCNAAYAKGGAEQAVKMLNMNLDLDIENFIAVSYHSLMDLIDGLGGIYIDVEEAALGEINGYQQTIVTDLGLPAYTPVTESGNQLLNGLQVTAYCRLRHDFPRGDLDRAAHQRKVLKAIEERAKQTDSATLAALFTKVAGKIHTNIDISTLSELVSNINKYTIADESGFPADDMVKIATLGKSGSCVVPIDLERNVIWLHQFLFDDEDYTPSQTVKEINAVIIEKASPYVSFQ